MSRSPHYEVRDSKQVLASRPKLKDAARALQTLKRQRPDAVLNLYPEGSDAPLPEADYRPFFH